MLKRAFSFEISYGRNLYKLANANWLNVLTFKTDIRSIFSYIKNKQCLKILKTPSAMFVVYHEKKYSLKL